MGDMRTAATVFEHLASVSLGDTLDQIAEVQRLQPKIDQLVAAYVGAGLAAVGIDGAHFLSRPDTLSRQDQLQLRDIPRQKIWWIELLAKISLSESGQQPSIDRLLDELLTALPFYQIELSLIQRAGERLPELIKTDGTSAIVETLFADDLMSRWYTEGTTYAAFNKLAREAVRFILDGSEMPVRVVEVGAGTGGLTAHLLDLFDPRNTSYVFTDVGAYFLRYAKRRFKSHSFVDYQLFDLEKHSGEQGLDARSFHFVVANNVIHDTKNVCFTLRNVAEMMSPGGMMLMLELTDPQSWWHMCFGSLEGWWRFKSDPTDHREDLMLLKKHEWLDLLADAGFTHTAVLSDHLPSDFANCLFLCQTSPA